MKISLISIGNELLNGRTLESNAHCLGQILAPLGLKLASHVTIPDDFAAIHGQMDSHLKHQDVIFISGGLGPTKDDFTKQAVADYLQASLIDSSEARKLAESHYARWGRPCDFESNQYHLIPERSRPLFNPIGMAPGIEIEIKGKKVFLLPGVPKEFKAISENIVKENSWRGDFQRFVLRTCYLPEEVLFFKKFPHLWEKLEAFGKVASLPHVLGVDIVIESQIKIEQASALKKKLKEICEEEGLDKHIWGYDARSPEEVLMQKLIDEKKTFSCAESCTGGLIAHKCTNLPGSSQFFMGGLVGYSNQSKQELLGVSPKALEQYGAVSEEVATHMATGVQEKFHTDFAVATSGIAGPTGGSAEKPIGTLAFALATPTSVQSKIFHFKGDREQLKERFARAAFFELLFTLRK